jgi:hypothetical protein
MYIDKERADGAAQFGEPENMHWVISAQKLKYISPVKETDNGNSLSVEGNTFLIFRWLFPGHVCWKGKETWRDSTDKEMLAFRNKGGRAVVWRSHA